MKEYIEQRIKELKATQEQSLSNYHGASGAIGELEAVLKMIEQYEIKKK